MFKIIKFETLYSTGTEKNYHHWLFYECDKRYETIYLKNNTDPKPGACFPQYTVDPTKYDKNWELAFSYCQKISLSWAVGGDQARMEI